MIKKEAYKEHDELIDKQFMWNRAAILERWLVHRDPLKTGHTPYQSAVVKREWSLYEFWRRNGPMPADRAEWERTCPLRDVDETAENWFRNNYTEAWEAKMREAGGKIPELAIEYPDFSQFEKKVEAR